MSTRFERFALVMAIIVALTILLLPAAFAEATTSDAEATDGQDSSHMCPHHSSAEAGNCPAGEPCPHHHKSHHGMHGDGAQGFGGIGRMADELGLSDTQKQDIAALLQIYQPRIKALLQNAESGRELLSMAPDNAVYSGKAEELSELAGASAAEMVILLSELQTNVYALLNADQQARYLELRQEQQARMDQRREEYKARRESGDPGYGYGKGKHSCPACDWLEADDQADAEASEQ